MASSTFFFTEQKGGRLRSRPGGKIPILNFILFEVGFVALTTMKVSSNLCYWGAGAHSKRGNEGAEGSGAQFW